MKTFPAWHLPGAGVGGGRPIAESEQGVVLAPDLTPAGVARAAAAVAALGPAISERPLDDVVAAIDGVARRFRDPADPIRKEALHWLPITTGYSLPMSAAVLDRMASDWTAPMLQRLLRAEFRNPDVLRRFVPHAPGQRVRALPPRLAFHVLAGNVPGVGVTSLVRSLLVGAPALCKTARAEPVLPVLFARALAEIDEPLGAAVAVAYWPGGDEALERPALAAADIVIHYGGGESLADLRRRAPAGSRIIDHGPRVSFAAVAREHTHLQPAAAGTARAVAFFDQHGCVSPHLVYCEEGGRIGAEEFAARVAAELGRLERELPRGRLATAEAAAAQQLRATVEFRAIAGQAARLWAGDQLRWSVAFDPDPAFAASCLGRFLWVKPVARLEDAIALAADYRHLLQTVAVSAPRGRIAKLAEAFALAGCSRITNLDAMPFPPPSWHHDGRGPLRELVRWADWEPSAK